MYENMEEPIISIERNGTIGTQSVDAPGHHELQEHRQVGKMNCKLKIFRPFQSLTVYTSLGCK